jgi:hypothetical protein
MGVVNSLRRDECGQVILFTAQLLPVLLGMTAIAVDVGGYADDKRNLQNAADAIALAAARDMCMPNPVDCSNTATARTTANAYAVSNNLDPSTMTVQFLGGNAAPKVRVTITHPHRFAFMPILGVNSKDVSVVAAAAKVSPGGIPGVVPYGVTQATLDAAGSGNDVVLKYDASGGSTSGNFGAISLDGRGAPPYTNDLQHGSPSTVCSQSTPGCDSKSCPGSFPSPCAENAPSCTGPVCDSEPGNKIGPTRAGIDYRLNNTSAGCQTFAQVFTAGGGALGNYVLNPDCNPWGAGACPVPDTGAPCSRRVIVVPIIDGFSNGRKPITILGFGLFFLEGYANGSSCTGNNCQVLGRFVKADVTMNALTGGYDPNSSTHFERLVE